MRILVFGAGAIGSVFAGLLAESGQNVTLLARGERLRQLERDGLRLIEVGGEIATPAVDVVAEVPAEAEFDYVLVCVRADQVAGALPVAAAANSPTIVPMVNHAGGYAEWAEIAGADRLLIGFPGTGAATEPDGVHYGIPSRLLEYTTLGELDGSSSQRLETLAGCLGAAGFNVETSKRIDAWQRYHAAYMGALLLGLRKCDGDVSRFLSSSAAKREVFTAAKEAFAMLRELGFPLTPSNLIPLRVLPARVLSGGLGLLGRIPAVRAMFAVSASRLAQQEAPTLGAQIIALGDAEGIEMPHYRRLLAG